MSRIYTLRSVILPTMMFTLVALGGCSRSVPAAPPGGVYVSTSAGANFDQSVQISEQPGKYIARFSLFDVFRIPSDPQTIYIAAGSNGIVKSVDAGQSWTVISTPLAQAVDAVVLGDKTVVVAGVDDAGQGYIIRSLDDGLTWQQVFTIPVPVDNRPKFLLGSDPTPSVVVTIEVDPFNPNRVYAASNLGTIFVGEQSAKTWRTFHTVHSSSRSPVDSRGSVGIRRLVISPHNPEEITVVTAANELIRIRDGSQEEIKVPQFINDAAPNGQARGTKDVFDVAYIPQFPNALLVGVEDGAVVTRDGGVTWIPLKVPVESAQKFNTVRVASSPTNTDRLFVIVNSVLYRSEDGGATWNTFSFNISNSVISEISINPDNASQVIAVVRRIQS